jgi:hypothetical protein
MKPAASSAVAAGAAASGTEASTGLATADADSDVTGIFLESPHVLIAAARLESAAA